MQSHKREPRFNKISDTSVVKLVRGWPGLLRLGLGDCTSITDRSLLHVANNLRELQVIILQRGGEISNAYVGSKGLSPTLTNTPSLRIIALVPFQSDLSFLVVRKRPDIDICRSCEPLRFRREANGERALAIFEGDDDGEPLIW